MIPTDTHSSDGRIALAAIGFSFEGVTSSPTWTWREVPLLHVSMPQRWYFVAPTKVCLGGKHVPTTFQHSISDEQWLGSVIVGSVMPSSPGQLQPWSILRTFRRQPLSAWPVDHSSLSNASTELFNHHFTSWQDVFEFYIKSLCLGNVAGSCLCAAAVCLG